MKKLFDLREFFIGVDGEKSSKRLFLFLLMILFCVYFFANLYFGRKLSASLEEYFFYLIVIFYFGVASEKWAPKKTVEIKEGNVSMKASNIDQSATVTKEAVIQ